MTESNRQSGEKEERIIEIEIERLRPFKEHPFQVKDTDETRIVMLYIWQRLYKLSPILFAPDLTGPFCQRGSCMEKQMSCQNPISKLWMPADILKTDYPLLIRKEVSSHKD